MPVPRVLAQCEVMLLHVVGHEELQRARPERAFAFYRRRNQMPAEMVGQLKRRDFALPQSVRKVPQRTLAPRRLVDALRDDVITLFASRQIDEKRRVRAVGHAAEHDDLTRLQYIERDVGRERPAFTKG